MFEIQRTNLGFSLYVFASRISRECTIYVSRGMSCVCVKGRVLCCNFMKKVWIKNANTVEGLTESGQWLATNFLGQRAGLGIYPLRQFISGYVKSP